MCTPGQNYSDGPGWSRALPCSAKEQAFFEKQQRLQKKKSESNHSSELEDRIRANVGNYHYPVDLDQLQLDEESRGRCWEDFFEHFEPVNGKSVGAGAFGCVVVYRCIKLFETRIKDIQGKKIVVKKGELVAGKNVLWTTAKHKDGTFNSTKRQTEKKKVRKEFWLMSSMNHPNVLKALEFFEDSGLYLILMEYISGGNLWELLRKEVSYSESFVRNLVQQLAAGVRHIHKSNIVHRDIKAENLLVRKKIKPGRIVKPFSDAALNDLDIEVVICDFGVSLALRPADMTESVIDSIAGSMATMAPEIFSNGYYSKACDFYSLGVVAHMLLTGGEIPYGLEYSATTEEVNRCMSHNLLDLQANYWGDVSPEARQFTAALLAKKPGDRLDLDVETINHKWFEKKFDPKHEAQIQTKNLQKFIVNMQEISNEMYANFKLLFDPMSLESRLNEIIDEHAKNHENNGRGSRSLPQSIPDIAGLTSLIDLSPQVTREMCGELREPVDTEENARGVRPTNVEDLRGGNIFEEL